MIDRMLWRDTLRAALTTVERRIIFETFWNGLTQAEIADTLHVSERTVSYHYQKALTRLKGYLTSIGLDSTFSTSR